MRAVCLHYPETSPGKSIDYLTGDQKVKREVLAFRHYPYNTFAAHHDNKGWQRGLQIKGPRVTYEDACKYVMAKHAGEYWLQENKYWLQDLFKCGKSIMAKPEMMWASLCCGMLYQRRELRPGFHFFVPEK